MSEAPRIEWPGESGKTYTHWIYPIGTPLKDVGGNYVFAKETSPGLWSPTYFGETGSLADRLTNHEKEACAKRHGATHIHAHVNESAAARLAEETDLIRRWKPACNEQHVNSSAAGRGW